MSLTLEDNRTLTLDRVLPAPLDAVWAAWTDAEKLPQWWGPRGFSCRTKEIDLRQGGLWRFDMIAPDGTVHVNRHRFTRIDPKNAIDYLCDDDGTGDHHFEAEVRFAKAEGGTRVTMTMTFPDAKTRQMVEDFGAVALGYTTLDCLTETAAPGTLSLTRLLNATPARVWRCWTEPADMAHWFFPAGVDIVSADFDPLQRKTWRTVMRDPKTGDTMTVGGRIAAVEADKRLDFTHQWENEDGSAAPETRVSVALHPTETGTRLEFVQRGLASDASRDGHRQGWTQTLDHLSAYLSQD